MSEKKLTVLHSWDDPYLKAKWALYWGIKYLLYAICKPFNIRFKFIDDIYNSTMKNMYLMIELDKLCGINNIFGIKTLPKEHRFMFAMFASYNKEKLNLDIRKHIHEGGKRLFEPLLLNSDNPELWHYDRKYIDGKELPLLKEGEYPEFHVDRPFFLSYYIDFLYEVLIQGKKIYRESQVV